MMEYNQLTKIGADVRQDQAANNLYYPLAFMFSMAAASKQEEEIFVDEFPYEFSAADMTDECMDLHWRSVEPAFDDPMSDHQKFTVCIHGPLTFSYGEPARVVEIDEIKLNYCIKEQCISIDLEMIRAEILCIIESRYGKPVIEFTFGTVSAKVRRLNLQNAKGGKKRQMGLYGRPHDFDRMIVWQAKEAGFVF